MHNRQAGRQAIKPTSKYAAAVSECFSFVLAIKISQKTDHHSKRNPPGASIAAHSN
jgi:hypothetical protein